MSYDVDLGDWNQNITFNLSPFFRRFLPVVDGDGLNGLHGLKGKKAQPIVARALARAISQKIEDPEAFHKEWSSPNGWGTADHALLFLAELNHACAIYKHDKIAIYR